MKLHAERITKRLEQDLVKATDEGNLAILVQFSNVYKLFGETRNLCYCPEDLMLVRETFSEWRNQYEKKKKLKG